MTTDNIREFFKEVLEEAQNRHGERKILVSCSIPSHWFSRNGKYKYLDEDTIDKMELNCLKIKLTLFIADCFGQR